LPGLAKTGAGFEPALEIWRRVARLPALSEV
jgi:hypothetical protein